MAPSKKGGEKKGHSAIDEIATRKYTIDIHKRIQSGFQEACPLGPQKDLEICHEKDRNLRCANRHQTQRSCLGQKNKECPIPHLGAVIQKT